ncbi:MAG: hypothetical protein O7B26_03620, partial [Planctomycetota bacterium]|nr:hypothetical protein [Planctomycetota bacterium]
VLVEGEFLLFLDEPRAISITTRVKLIVNPEPGALCAFAGDPIFFCPRPPDSICPSIGDPQDCSCPHPFPPTPGCTPQLQGMATGGVPPYTFSWCPSDNHLDDASSLTPTLIGDGLTETTEYVLTVMDANGSCDVSRVFIIVNGNGPDGPSTCDQAPCP